MDPRHVQNVITILPLSERGAVCAAQGWVRSYSEELDWIDAKLAKRVRDAYATHGEAFEALAPFAGGGGTVVGDAGPAVAEYVEARHVLRDTLNEAADAIEAARVKISDDAESEEAEAVERARAMCAALDDERDKIAKLRAARARARDKKGSHGHKAAALHKHRPGGAQTTAAILGLEPPVEYVYVTPAEFRKLQRAGEVTPLHRVKHNVPTSALAGDAPGGAFA
jgi:hypothetical protein